MRIDSANENRHIGFIILHIRIQIEMQPAASDAFCEADENVKMHHTATANRYVGFNIMQIFKYSLLHLKCHPISISNLVLIGLFSSKCAKRDPEHNQRMGFAIAEMTIKCNRLHMCVCVCLFVCVSVCVCVCLCVCVCSLYYSGLTNIFFFYVFIGVVHTHAFIITCVYVCTVLHLCSGFANTYLYTYHIYMRARVCTYTYIYFMVYT